MRAERRNNTIFFFFFLVHNRTTRRHSAPVAAQSDRFITTSTERRFIILTLNAHRVRPVASFGHHDGAHDDPRVINRRSGAVSVLLDRTEVSNVPGTGDIGNIAL